MKKVSRILALVCACVFMLYPVLASAAVTYSVTIKKRSNVGDQAMTIAQIDLAGTYATDGFTLTPKSFGLSTINQVVIPNYSGYSFEWDRANGKVKVYSGTADFTPAGTNAAQTVTVSYTASTSGMVPLYIGNTAGAQTLYAVFTSDTSSARTIAIPAQTFTGTAVSAGASEEVDNGTSLASVNTIEIVVFGH